MKKEKRSAREMLEVFELDDDLLAWCRQQGIDNPSAYVEEFKDYWRSVGYRRANGREIADWPAAFRNSMRRLKADKRLKKPSVWDD